MARRKKHHKTHHRRRRVGGVGLGGFMDGLMTLGGIAGGIIAGRMLNNLINDPTKPTPSLSPTLLGFGETGAAVYVSKQKGDKKMNPLLRGAILGLGGNGLIYALGSKGMGVLPAAIGYGPDMMHRPARTMLQGFRDVPKIGFPKPGAIGAGRDRARMARTYSGIYG